jgi:hypothetical protein
MESNYEIGERIALKYPYVHDGYLGTFIPSGEFVLLIDGPFESKKYGLTVFSWSILSPCGKLIKMAEDYFF